MSIDYSTFAFPKGQKTNKKTPKKRVSKSTYEEVFEASKGKCGLCGTNNNLELHHIQYRSEDKSKIDDPGNCIMLCKECHQKAHNNKKLWKPRLIKIRESLKRH